MFCFFTFWILILKPTIFFYLCQAGWLVPEGYLSDNEGVEEEEEKYNRFVGKSSSSKRIAVRKIVLGPHFQGETEEDEVMKPFETNFFIGKVQIDTQWIDMQCG